MKKNLILTACVLGVLHSTGFAASGSDNEAYKVPTQKETRTDKRALKKESVKNEPLPIVLNCDKANYDQHTGDFVANGNVRIVQGDEVIITTVAKGNMKTGDIYFEEGGTLEEPNNKTDAEWAHYNFNSKAGELKSIKGKSGPDFYEAPHAILEDGKMIVDQGGSTSRCPAVDHTKCVSIEAKTITVYPGEKIEARNVKVFVKGKHIYSRDRWINTFGDGEDKIMPRIGYESGEDKGFYVKLEVEKSLFNDNKTNVFADLVHYSKAGYKPTYGIVHDTRNFELSLKSEWDYDTNDIWLKKESEWGFRYKSKRISSKLPLSYSGYLTHGLWSYENQPYNSWHTETAIFLTHDRINLFNSKKTALDLTIGRKWVRESYKGASGDDENNSTSNIYHATLTQFVSPKLTAWTGYYREDLKNSLYDYGSYGLPDMARELRTGISYTFDDRNSVSVINRYDAGNSKSYETSYRYIHRFCCWAVEVEYLTKNHNSSNEWNIKYNLLNW